MNDKPKVVSIKTRGAFQPAAPAGTELVGPVKPAIDQLSLSLIDAVRERVLSGEIIGVGFIGIDPNNLPVAAMTIPSRAFSGPFYGVRLMAIEVLKEIIMDELADVSAHEFHETDEDTPA